MKIASRHQTHAAVSARDHRHGESAFLLQNFYVKEYAENLMMHLLVEDVESWWERAHDVLSKYGLKSEPPKDQPWGIRDFTLPDPSGVLWRIGQNTEWWG
jgi:uncharacterized glyoxalase superfamily protein PhnB